MAILSPGYGLIKAGGRSLAICSNVPKFVGYATIVACKDGTVLWEPVSGATSATVSLQNPQNCPDAWIALKLIGAATPLPCAAKGSLTFAIPPETSNILFTVYFPTKSAVAGVNLVWNPSEIQPYCP